MHLLVAPRKDAECSSFTRDAGGSKEMGIAMQGLEKSLNTTSHRGGGKEIEMWAHTTVKKSAQRARLATLLNSFKDPGHFWSPGRPLIQSANVVSECILAARNRTNEGTTFLDVLQKLQFSNVCNPSLSAMTQCLTETYSQDTRPQNPFSATQLHTLKQRKR